MIIRARVERHTALLRANFTAKFVSKKVRDDDDDVITTNKPMVFVNANNIILTQPVDYIHVIDEESPLFGMSADDVKSSDDNFEIVAYLEGKTCFKQVACYKLVSALLGTNGCRTISRKNVSRYRMARKTVCFSFSSDEHTGVTCYRVGWPRYVHNTKMKSTPFFISALTLHTVVNWPTYYSL